MERDKLLEYIWRFMPLLHKKLFKHFHGYEMSRQQIRLLATIKENDGKPMKCYGKKLMISKPNLTTAVNKLIDEAMVERKTDDSDRRKINLFITKKGEELLSAHKEIMKKDMLKRLEVLSDEDIKKLNKNFEEMQSIFSKLD